jgi:PEP-CTERM motif-containing protein
MRTVLKLQWLLASLIFGLALIPHPAAAIILSPGGSGSPDAFSLGDSSAGSRTVLASTSRTWGSGAFTGSLYEQVESDPLNIFCSGCVDLIVQLRNDSSTENIIRVLQVGFTGVRTDVGYDVLSLGSGHMCGPDDNGFCNSGNPATVPGSVDRSSSGDVVGFNWTGVPPGESTVDLVIETDARSFSTAQMTILGSAGDQGNLRVYGFSPVAGVPEPSTLLLLASGLIALCTLPWTRHRRT